MKKEPFLYTMNLLMANTESVLKGKLAESLVEELLKRSGNRVYRLGSDALLENIVSLEPEFNKEGILGKKIASIPDFALISGRGKPIFVEVKFRSEPESLEEELLLEKEWLEKFWEAKIILVTAKEKPYFRVLTPPYFAKEKREGWPIPVCLWKPLELDQEFAIENRTIQEFEALAQKYFSKK